MEKWTIEDLLQIDARAELARRHFKDFVSFTFPGYEWNWHHVYLANKVNEFAHGRIKRLAVFIPPQYGKSEICSRRLPAYLLGINPDLKIAGCSYTHSLSAKFNRDVQRIITGQEYREVFPDTNLNDKNIRSSAEGSWLRNSDQFEIVGCKGGYISVGVGGGLTGNRVDVGIIDDPVKDAVEGSSPSYQARNWEWYNSVFKSRGHKDSQELLIMTRWDINDLAGMILKYDPDGWDIVSMPALKVEDHDPNDPREVGEALWPQRHSLDDILAVQKRSPKIFASLYQQNPRPPEDILIFGGSTPISEFPQDLSVFYGLDFGFSNSQLALIKVALNHEEKIVYCDEMLYEVGLTHDDLMQRIRFLNPSREIMCVYCDGAEPKSVEQLDREPNIRAIGIKKFPNSVLTMIQKLQEYEIRYTSNSHNFDQERRLYQWKIGPDGFPINQEIDKYNHLHKALMYAVWGEVMQGPPKVRYSKNRVMTQKERQRKQFRQRQKQKGKI